MKHLLLAAILTLVGCSHIELEYRGDIELDDGRQGSVVYQSSYSTGGHQLACILTGIFYGGWCWAYLAMPMDDQDADIRNDAEDFIERRYDGKGVISYGYAHRLGWDPIRPRAKVRLDKSETLESQGGKEPAAKEEDKAEEKSPAKETKRTAPPEDADPDDKSD